MRGGPIRVQIVGHDDLVGRGDNRRRGGTVARRMESKVFTPDRAVGPRNLARADRPDIVPARGKHLRRIEPVARRGIAEFVDEHQAGRAVLDDMGGSAPGARVIGGQIEAGPHLSVAVEYDLSIPVRRRRTDTRYLQESGARNTGGGARQTVDESQRISILCDRCQRNITAARSRDGILAAERYSQPDRAVGPFDAAVVGGAHVDRARDAGLVVEVRRHNLVYGGVLPGRRDGAGIDECQVRPALSDLADSEGSAAGTINDPGTRQIERGPERPDVEIDLGHRRRIERSVEY